MTAAEGGGNVFNSISTKLVAAFLVIGLVPLAFVSYSSIGTVEEGFKQAVKGQLYFALERAIGSLLDVFYTMQAKSTQVNSNQFLLDGMEKLSKTPNDEETIQALSEFLASQKEVVSRPLSPTLPGIPVMELTIINAQGTAIASTSPDRTGQDFSSSPEFYAPDMNAPKNATDLNNRLGYDENITFAMVTPLRSRDENAFIGAVMVVYPFKALQDAMQGTAYRELLLQNPAFAQAITSTGNIGGGLLVYGADANGKVTLPPSQERSQRAAFTKVLDNEAVRTCTDENKSFAGEYAGYNGEEAYGVNLCSATRTSFIAEVPSKTAFASLEAAKAQIINNSLLVTAFIILAGLLFARTITQPLKELTKVIDDLSKGDLTAEISPRLKNSGDEIGVLANSFERTMVSLKLAMLRKKPKD